MGYSLGQAAKEVGVSKPTIQRAIKSGKLSATRNDDGSYDIDPSELLRAFPEGMRASNDDGSLKQDETPNDTGALRAEIEGMREQIGLLKDERDDLRRRLDQADDERRRAQTQLTALLTDQRDKPEPRKGFWRRVFG